MQEDRFLTIFGNWIKASDVENPDELVDPGAWYDHIFAPNEEGDDKEEDDDDDEFDLI